jgi:hypothetical protein
VFLQFICKYKSISMEYCIPEEYFAVERLEKKVMTEPWQQQKEAARRVQLSWLD